MLNFKQVLLVTVLSLSLAACGGGGESESPPVDGGSGTNPSASLSMTLGKTSLVIDERSSTSFAVSVSYTGSKSLSYTLKATPESASSSAKISVSGNQITVDALDVTANTSFSVDVTVTDGTVSSKATFNVTINNVDAPEDVDPKSVDLTLSPASLTMDEGDSKQVVMKSVFDGKGVPKYSYKVISGNQSALTITNVEDALIVKAVDVAKDENLEIEVTSTVGNVSDTEKLVVAVKNISALAIVTEAKLWADTAKSFAFNDFNGLADVYVKAAYFAGSIGYSEQETVLADFSAQAASARQQANSTSALTLKSVLASYENGSAKDSDLANAVKEVKQLASAQSSLIISKLNTLAEMANGTLPQVTAGEYKYIEEYGVFSSVIGNAQMGSFSGKAWSFTGVYEFFNTKVAALGNIDTCEAN